MSTKKQFIEKVAKIQKELKAPKSQRNTFGNYNYRNQEDILEAVKPLLKDLVLTINDELIEIGGRVYVKSTSTITDGEFILSNSAFAREPETAKGMNDSQITGSASSYSRKYSLNGLFLIDDTKDADSDEVSALSKDKKETSPKFAKPKQSTNEVEANGASEQVESSATSESSTPSRRSFRRA